MTAGEVETSVFKIEKLDDICMVAFRLCTGKKFVLGIPQKKKKAYINNPFVVQLAIFIIMVKFQNNVNLIKDKHKNT